MSTSQRCYGSGEAARRLTLPTWKFLYLIDRGILPEASFRIAGRRAFTEDDLEVIADVLASRAKDASEKATCSVREQ